jgi:7-cyano-7-deazaguanine synthase
MTQKVVVMSGGLDSTTLLYRVAAETFDRHEDVKAISFDYGQRHKKELEFAAVTAKLAGVEHEVIDITSITSFIAAGGSSLVADTEVPEGHYGEESMKATVVPNRNMIMSSIAAGHAVAIGASTLWLGVHAGDHFIYPDCRPRFFRALNAAIVFGNEGFGSIDKQQEFAYPQEFVQTPFIEWSKTDIAEEAIKLNVPLDLTWSCYKGGDIHCGKCGTCVERIEAIQEALERLGNPFTDPTQYEDSDFWKEALKRETV